MIMKTIVLVLHTADANIAEDLLEERSNKQILKKYPEVFKSLGYHQKKHWIATIRSIVNKGTITTMRYRWDTYWKTQQVESCEIILDKSMSLLALSLLNGEDKDEACRKVNHQLSANISLRRTNFLHAMLSKAKGVKIKHLEYFNEFKEDTKAW